MKLVMASLAASLLLACGSEPGVNFTLYVDAPDANLCVGVAGFDVIVSSASGEETKVRRRVPTTILAGKDCLLPGQFSFPELNLDAPVTVTVNGYDGSGRELRVQGQKSLSNLRDGSVHLSLVAGPSKSPVLVFYRNPLLDGVPIEQISGLTISKAMGGTGPLLSVDRLTAGELFDAEPGAYGIPGFLTEPPADGTVLTVSFAVEPMIKNKRITVHAPVDGYYSAQ